MGFVSVKPCQAEPSCPHADKPSLRSRVFIAFTDSISGWSAELGSDSDDVESAPKEFDSEDGQASVSQLPTHGHCPATGEESEGVTKFE